MPQLWVSSKVAGCLNIQTTCIIQTDCAGKSRLTTVSKCQSLHMSSQTLHKACMCLLQPHTRSFGSLGTASAEWYPRKYKENLLSGKSSFSINLKDHQRVPCETRQMVGPCIGPAMPLAQACCLTSSMMTYSRHNSVKVRQGVGFEERFGYCASGQVQG